MVIADNAPEKHCVMLTPAVPEGGLSQVTFLVDVALGQPGLETVRVSVPDPESVDGFKTQPFKLVALLRTAVPAEAAQVQRYDKPLPVALAPLVMMFAVEQCEMLPPALAVGGVFIVTVIERFQRLFAP
jgi:hypothetical protein